MRIFEVDRSPYRQKLQESLDKLDKTNSDASVELLFIFSQWSDGTVDPSSIFGSMGTRYCILAQLIPYSKQIIVAILDKNQSSIMIVGLYSEDDIGRGVGIARFLIPPTSHAWRPNPHWEKV